LLSYAFKLLLSKRENFNVDSCMAMDVIGITAPFYGKTFYA